MAYLKARQVEPGIWLVAKSKDRLKEIRELEKAAEAESEPRKRSRILSKLPRGPYLAEASYIDPDTWKRVRKRQTFNRLDMATSWRRKMLDDEDRQELIARQQGRALTFADFAPEYLRHWSRERKPSTVYVETLRINSTLIPVFGDRGLGTISQRDVEAFLTRRCDIGVTPATTNRDLCRIKNIFRKAQEWGLIASNPAAEIKQAREQIVEQDFLAEDEVANLIEACDDRLRPLVVTAVHTGMRWGELVGLEWRDVHFDRESIHIRDPKNSVDRHIPMNSDVLQALNEHKERQAVDVGGIVRYVFANSATGKPWTDIRKMFRTALVAAGIERHFLFKNLRHTAASHMVMRGVDIRTVGKVLGHLTLEVTMRYAHLSPEHLREAVGRLTYSKTKRKTKKKGA